MVKDDFVDRAVEIANDDTHGYSQPGRYGIDYDCSSLVGRCLNDVGIDCGFPDKWSYTGDELIGLVNTGLFEEIYFDRYSIQRGDILLTNGHTEIVVDYNTLVGAERSETHGIDGEQGDQDGLEISVHTYWNDNWHYIIRYCGEDDIVTDADKQDIANRVLNTIFDSVTGDGTKGSLIDRISWIDMRIRGMGSGMTFLCDWNGSGKTVYYDGVMLHWLDNPDVAEAIKMAYRNSHCGCEIPQFVLGSKEAKWASRLGEGILNGHAGLEMFESKNK